MDSNLKSECFKEMLWYVPMFKLSLLCDRFNMICKLACASTDKLQTHATLPSSTAPALPRPPLLLQPPHLTSARHLLLFLYNASFSLLLVVTAVLPQVPSSESSLPLCFLLTSLSFWQQNEKAKKWKQ